MKQFFTFHWQRFLAWLERVEKLKSTIEEKDLAIARLQGRIAAMQEELDYTRTRAENAEASHKQAARGSELLARWIKTTHRLDQPAIHGSIKELLAHANHR